ncbi:MAG: ATP-binding protein [Solirubrobacteraceae bacterium]
MASASTPRFGEARALIGRGPELELIMSFLDRAVTDGEALLLLGEPGVGKTALLEVAAASASAAGGLVLRAAGVEFEAELTFSGLHQALVPLHEEFDELDALHCEALKVAVGLGEGPPPDRLVIASATLTLLRRAARSQPVLVIVDDVPWLDRASAAVLGFVARRLSGSRVGLLAASRTDDDSFFERAGLPEIELGPLDETAAGDLMDARFPKLASAVRERLLAEAQGNPLALLELPVALSGPQRAALSGLPPVLPLPRRLHALFRSRVGELAEGSRRLLLLMALDGSGDLGLIQATGDHDKGLEDLEAAERAGLAFLGDTHRLTFRHPLIRSAVVELSTVVERRWAHGLLAELLPDHPDRRVWHLAQATVGPDEHVAALLEEAGHRVLRRGDGVGAVNSLIRAADLSPTRADRDRRLAVAAYVGASVRGELRRAKALLETVRLANPNVTGSLEEAIAASYLLLHSDGDVDTAHRLLVAALESSRGQELDDVAIEEALRTLAMASFYGGRGELWESFGRVLECLTGEQVMQARFRAELIGDPVRSSREALNWLDAEIDSLGGELDPAKILRTAGAATNVYRLRACREPLQRLVSHEPEGGAVTGYAQMMLGLDSFRAGRWIEARTLSEGTASLATAEGHGLLAWNARAIQAFVAAASGDDAEARTIAERMLQWAGPRGIRAVQADAFYALTLSALARGDFEDAYHQATAISPAGLFAPHRPHALHVMMDLVEAAVRTGRHTEASSHVAALREAKVAAISPRLALVGEGATAIAAPDGDARNVYERALKIPGADRWPFDFARVQLAYGERLRRDHAMSESRAQLHAALELFEGLGARPWSARAAGELRASGQTKLRVAERDRDKLTPQELEIATLAATGLSNKQIGQRLFLSHRTVATHLYKAFPKLGITSRAALRDALATLSAKQPADGHQSHGGS